MTTEEQERICKPLRNFFIILLCLFCSDKNPDISKSSVVYMDAVMIKLVKAAVKADGL